MTRNKQYVHGKRCNSCQARMKASSVFRRSAMDDCSIRLTSCADQPRAGMRRAHHLRIQQMRNIHIRSGIDECCSLQLSPHCSQAMIMQYKLLCTQRRLRLLINEGRQITTLFIVGVLMQYTPTCRFSRSNCHQARAHYRSSPCTR